jgi:membrane peptidoglycan carboxypeptidase
VGEQNRIPVRLDAVPEDVQRAVLAAEDRDHYTNPGISPRGIARALFANVRGGGIEQGGSSITQQYAKNAFLTQDRTFRRKVQEVFIALKMSRTVSKDQILEDYLNTIYFGRQASGIEVASPVVLRHPGLPAHRRAGRGARLEREVAGAARPGRAPRAGPRALGVRPRRHGDQGLAVPEERAAQVYPEVLPVGAGNRNNDRSGPKGHVITAVLDELAVRGFGEDRLAEGGLVVQTTIRKQAQDAAVAAVQGLTGPAPATTRCRGRWCRSHPGPAR